MPEMVQHPYECQAKGHQGGSRTFMAAPPEWFAAKGMSTPKNCPDCRAWTKAQVDEMKTCACGLKIRIPATLKISTHKKVGPYVPITECRSCRDGNRPPKGVGRRPEKRKKEKDKREREFSDLRPGITPQPRVIVTSPAPYAAIFVKNYQTQERESRATHLEHHLVGSPNSWTDPVKAAEMGLKKPSSPTSFAAEDQTLSELLEFTQSYMLATSSENVREYVVGDGRIVRITFTGDHDGLEKTILEDANGRYMLVTTHDNMSVQDVEGQLWYKGGVS